MRELKNHLVNNPIDADRSRYRRHARVRWHLRNETLRVKLAQLFMTHAASHHRNMVDICLDNHRLQRIVGVARGEFILHMIVPASGKSLLRTSETGAGKVTHQEFETAQVREFRSSGVVMFAVSPPKGVVETAIIVNRYEWVRIERGVNLCLCFGWAILVFLGDVKQQRVCNTS